MTMMRKKLIVVMLIALLGVGALANAASGISVCPPKKCCCTPNAMAMSDHNGSIKMMDHSISMEMGMADGCAHKDSAPCCNLESDELPVDLALSTVSNSDQYRSLASQLATDIHIDTPLDQSQIDAYRDVGWPKIPKVPILLQTLSILC